MNTTAIKNFAQRARRDFRKLVTDKAHALGIAKKEVAKAEEHGDALVIHGQTFPLSIKRQREELIAIVRQQGFDHVVDAMAYTLFNRLCALRFMEVHDYLPQRVLSAKDGGDAPDILKNAADVADKLFKAPQDRKAIKDLKLAGTKDQELYRRLILAQCNALAAAMPFLFEKQQDYSELLMPDNLLHSDSVVRDMVKSIEEADWQEIEIIGWLYQFYISERKDEVIGSVVEKADIPAATQLFTPKWIVRYMVENSLGRLWLESHPDSPLRAKMPYYIENPDEGNATPAKRFDTPDDIKCIDDACGSGHILVYKFDLLYEMYAECGYPKTEIPALILKNNLYGLDIDERAVQLASFALMMKARERDSRFLEKNVSLNVLAIQESNGIDLDAMFNMGVRDARDRSPFDDASRLFADQGLLPIQGTPMKDDEKDIKLLKKDLQPIVQLFHDAKNYGSLLLVPSLLNDSVLGVSKRVNQVVSSAQLFDQVAIRLLISLLRQASVLGMQFDVCVTNPPWMGSKSFNAALKSFVEKKWRNGKADLYGCFMLRNLEFVRHQGHVGLITIPNWMFLEAFSELRNQMLGTVKVQSLVHNGRGVWGSDFGSCSFVVRKEPDESHHGVYKRLFRRQGEVQTNDELHKNFFDEKSFPNFMAAGRDLRKVPGCPIAYWISNATRDLFAGDTLEQFAESGGRCKTTDDVKYLRRTWEVSSCNVGNGKRWCHLFKGGESRRYYGNREFLIDWSDDARSFYASVGGLTKAEFWGRIGITWTIVTASATSAFRYKSNDSQYNSVSPTIFAKKNDELFFFLSLLNSSAVGYLLRVLNPTLATNVGNVLDIPVPRLGKGKQRAVEIGQELVALSHRDWDDFETSSDFEILPLLRSDIKGTTIEESWLSYAGYCSTNIQKLLQLEVENNGLFIEAYNLQDELSPEVRKEEITLARADAEKDIKAFISYAIGCMMGRYSLSKQGLQFAGGEWDDAKFKGAKFQPDADGILPILGDAFFEDDPAERLAEFLAVTFGKETLNENLQFIAQTLGMKGNESPRDTIRRYLADGFFKDHLRTYKKRPIYWLFSSGKEQAFQALVYMHRYTPATLSRMRTAYLHELQNKLDARVDEVQQAISEATSTAQSNRLNKELTRIKKQQAELLTFDEKLNNLAGKKIAIDLDDGVKHNYGLFGDLLAEVKTVCGKDEE